MDVKERLIGEERTREVETLNRSMRLVSMVVINMIRVEMSMMI